jgi:hypothetical protein
MLGLANHLPATVELWHCSLPEVFLQEMPSNVRDAVENDSTLSATLSATQLSTKDGQLHALRTVRTAASFKKTELDRIRKLMLETCAEHTAAAGAKTKATTSLMASESEKSVLKKKLRFSDGDASPVFLSPAEQTLQRYSQPNPQSRGVGKNGLPIEDPVCAAKGNVKFPINPTTQEISDFLWVSMAVLRVALQTIGTSMIVLTKMTLVQNKDYTRTCIATSCMCGKRTKPDLLRLGDLTTRLLVQQWLVLIPDNSCRLEMVLVVLVGTSKKSPTIRVVWKWFWWCWWEPARWLVFYACRSRSRP